MNPPDFAELTMKKLPKPDLDNVPYKNKDGQVVSRIRKLFGLKGDSKTTEHADAEWHEAAQWLLARYLRHDTAWTSRISKRIGTHKDAITKDKEVAKTEKGSRTTPEEDAICRQIAKAVVEEEKKA